MPHISPRRRVCFAIVDMVSVSGSTPGFGRGDRYQVTVIFEHALQIEGLLELLTDERLDLEPDDRADRSCSPSATTGRR